MRQYALFRVKEDFAEALMPEHLPEDHAGVQCNLLVLVTFERGEDDIGF